MICYYWDFKLAHFVEHSISYQPSKFQPSWTSRSNFTGGGGRGFIGTKKPSAFRVNGHLCNTDAFCRFRSYVFKLCTIYLERSWELNNYFDKLCCVSVLYITPDVYELASETRNAIFALNCCYSMITVNDFLLNISLK